MKQIILIGAMLDAGSLITHAQTIGTMMQQLVSLERLRETTENGYNAVVSGIHKIGEIKDGELHLQQAYFLSLTEMNPAIIDDAREEKEVDAMVKMQNYLLEELYKAMEYYKHMQQRNLKTEENE